MAFGQEMQDFIAAFQVGSTIKQKKRQMALDETQETNRSKEASAKLADSRSRYDETMAFNREKFDTAKERNAGIDARSQTALDLQKGAQDRLAAKEADDAWYKQVEADPESGYDAAGNVIPPPSQRGKPSEAIPTGPAGQETPDRIGTVGSSGMGDLVVNPDTVADAIDGGLKTISSRAGAGGIQAIMEGEGAPAPQTVQAVDSIIDPDNQMTEAQKTLARLEATYEFYLTKYKGKDGVERANEAAAQWLQHARGVAAIQAQAAMALNAKGDTAGAAKKLAEMHDSIPDGMSTTYDEASNTFTMTDDQTGEVLQQGEVTPEMIDQIAASFTKGPEFFKVMMSAAQRSKNFNPGAGTKAKEEKPITSAALKEQEPLAAEANVDEIDAALYDVVSKELVDIDGAPIFGSPDEFADQVGPDSKQALVDLATMITAYNRIPPKDAAKLALVITDPDVMVGDPSEQQFDGFKLPKAINEANRKAGKDIMVLETPDGRQLELPGNDATVAIQKANHGLWIAAKAITDKNVAQTNERVINDNNQYNLQREEDDRLRQEGNRTGARGAVPAAPLPPKRTGRGG